MFYISVAKADDRLVREVESLRAENAVLSTTGEGKEKRIKFLEEQLRSREQRYHADCKNASQIISDLEKEIENRTATIVQLNAQVHQIKKQSRERERGVENNRRERAIEQSRERERGTGNSRRDKRIGKGIESIRTDRFVEVARKHGMDVSTENISNDGSAENVVRPKAGETVTTMEPLSLSPTPPPGTPNRRVRSSRRSGTPPKQATANVDGLIKDTSSSHHIDCSSASLKQASRTAVGVSPRHKHTLTDPARPSLGHSQVQRERGLRIANSARPKPTDYEDFLNIHSMSDVNILTKATSEPLPPITTRPQGRQLRTNTMRTRAPNNTKTSSKQVEELIIEPLASPDKTIRLTQSPTSSKYV